MSSIVQKRRTVTVQKFEEEYIVQDLSDSAMRFIVVGDPTVGEDVELFEEEIEVTGY